MPHAFIPDCLPTLVGSFPLEDHTEAVHLVMRYVPKIPSWSQLPVRRKEGMIAQFVPGFPGVVEKNGKVFVDGEGEDFQSELIAFYEEYLSITDGAADLMESRFSLKNDTAPGFFELFKEIQKGQTAPVAVKGQVTGPVTFATALLDHKGAPLFYDLQLRDAAVKLLTLKARWQVRRLKDLGVPVILSVDEPGLAGFGSSEFTSISREAVSQCLKEVIEGIQVEGGMAGIHVCANTDWSIILSLPFDVINFDAYAYFDRFILYAEEVKRFLESGGVLAWGMIPTLSQEALRKESVESLLALWEDGVRRVVELGIPRDALIRQSLITPACGMGSLPLDLTEKVLKILRGLSAAIRGEKL